MGTKEDVVRKRGGVSSMDGKGDLQKTADASPSNFKKNQINRKPNHSHRNIKQIFVLSFDALRERKTRSILTILMVVAGGALMVALNGMSAGVADLINKQLSILAPNVLFVTPGQINFRGGPTPPSTIVFNLEVVNRIKSLPYVEDVIPTYTAQAELNAQGRSEE